MFRSILAVAAATILAPPADANPLGQLYQFTGQIRSQMGLVRAQAEATFSCPRGRLIADDVFDELDDLCRELDRLEGQIGRPMLSRQQLVRLERAVHRLDDQACAVEEAVRQAVAARSSLPGNQVGFLPQQGPIGYPGITTSHTVGHRGVRVLVGGGRFSLAVGGGAPAVSPYAVGRPTFIGRPAHDAEGAALCAQAQTLRRMTQQLLSLVCHG